jgi:hypothetical protein
MNQSTVKKIQTKGLPFWKVEPLFKSVTINAPVNKTLYGICICKILSKIIKQPLYQYFYFQQ